MPKKSSLSIQYQQESQTWGLVNRETLFNQNQSIVKECVCETVQLLNSMDMEQHSLGQVRWGSPTKRLQGHSPSATALLRQDISTSPQRDLQLLPGKHNLQRKLKVCSKRQRGDWCKSFHSLSLIGPFLCRWELQTLSLLGPNSSILTGQMEPFWLVKCKCRYSCIALVGWGKSHSYWQHFYPRSYQTRVYSEGRSPVQQAWQVTLAFHRGLCEQWQLDFGHKFGLD